MRDRYTNHRDPAIRLLNKIANSLPIRSIGRDIVVCALLYLEGDKRPGHTVESWWNAEVVA